MGGFHSTPSLFFWTLTYVIGVWFLRLKYLFASHFWCLIHKGAKTTLQFDMVGNTCDTLKIQSQNSQMAKLFWAQLWVVYKITINVQRLRFTPHPDCVIILPIDFLRSTWSRSAHWMVTKRPWIWCRDELGWSMWCNCWHFFSWCPLLWCLWTEMNWKLSCSI